MSNKWLVKNTTNSGVYNRALKRFLETTLEISCGYCPYHRRENFNRHDNVKRSWKKYRKTQYK